MTDLLDAFETDESLAEDMKAPPCYLNYRTPQDFTARVEAAGFGVHENDESVKNGESYFRIDLCVEGIETSAFGSSRNGAGGYDDVELRVGDRVAIYVYASSVAVKASQKKANFRNLTNYAAAFSGARATDYYPKGQLGPAAIRAVFGDGTTQAGKLVHILGKDTNDKGYTNPTLNLVPEAPKGKAKAKK